MAVFYILLNVEANAFRPTELSESLQNISVLLFTDHFITKDNKANGEATIDR